MTRWRWDQGRLLYFQFNVLRLIAKSLIQIENIQINVKGFDPLREVLEKGTGMPFSPSSYKVWRNYKRVIECSMIATSINNQMFITDIGKWLASNEEIDVDDYVFVVVRRFRFPYPAFQDYDNKSEVIYPFSAIMKYLIANFDEDQNSGLSLNELFEVVIGNSCTGLEELEHYKKLKRTNRQPIGDEKRQVREMIMFLSQASILKLVNRKIYRDVTQSDLIEYDYFLPIISPEFSLPKPIREEDFIAITSLDKIVKPQLTIKSRESILEELFTEGKRVRVTHVKIERSPMLRKLYFQENPTTTCDMCTINMKIRYPWTLNLLEIHHILPLSSSLAMSSKGTSLEDVVPLCPTCHRSVHNYYKVWLNGSSKVDFTDKFEAAEVYSEAKRLIVL